MRIAFDAKRAFENSTGLGNYSRMLIDQLIADFPANEYYLMAPRHTSVYRPQQSPNVHVITPSGIGRSLPSLWRSGWVKNDLKRLGIDIYHGLSHEIPVGIGRTGIRSVVTIHDLIFEYYPEQYKAADVKIYRKKFKYACEHATHIISVSNKTREDLVELYKVPASKISVCYPSVMPVYEHIVNDGEREAVREKYRLPAKYLLYVGSIVERKNLLNICKALHVLKDKVDLPLVVIGSGSGNYATQVNAFINANGMQAQVQFLERQQEANDPKFKSSEDFPAIYQSAEMLLYPSVYEGFGLPVLEALWSRIPVITSNTSCLPETGGDAAYYVDPTSVDELANAILTVSSNDILRQQMIRKGIAHAQKFAPQIAAAKVMEVYKNVYHPERWQRMAFL
ncbi:MAG: glycosyltransferase family 4 protein [Bacteroidetes bacterium]|nr:glycosyltransferase family 4 protein [Bacteroidota bacterium]